MTHSIQFVKGKVEILNDLDLLLVLGIMIDEIEENRRYSSLKRFVPCWDKCRKSSGPGTLDLRLESVALDVETKQEFVDLLAEIKNSIASEGSTIGADKINERWGIPGVEFASYESASIIATVKRLCHLVSG